MRDCEIVFLVYGQEEFQGDKSYFSFALFSNIGHIEREPIVKSYEMEIDTWKLNDSDRRIGPFINLEYLQKFAFALCQRLDASEVVLLSIDAYNDAVEKSTDVEGLIQHFKHNGDVLKNVDSNSKKSFLDRIFH